MAASDVVVEEFDDLGFTLSDPQIIDRLVSELKNLANITLHWTKSNSV